MGKKALVIKFSDVWDRMRLMYTRDNVMYTLSWDTYKYFCATGSMIADRQFCETDISLLQVIPYVVLYKHTDNGLLVLTYVRGKGGTETRLHDKLSVGLGGHIEEMPNYPDECLDTVIYRGAVRELEEELGKEFVTDELRESLANSLLVNKLRQEPCLSGNIPLIYHSRATPVDEVHLGIFTLVPVTEDTTTFDIEKDVIEETKWVRFDTLKVKENYDRLETWSKAVIDNLDKVLNSK